MPYRKSIFANGEIYHVYNRGVAKLPIFYSDSDYRHFLETLHFYEYGNIKTRFSQNINDFPLEKEKKIVEILCYCLMPNHYHLLLRQLKDDGIATFMRKGVNSYVRYFNTKKKRVGPLFQGRFKAVHIEDSNQLMHISRYIHLNPIVGFVSNSLEKYQWSSYLSYITKKEDKNSSPDAILELFANKEVYKKFVLDHVDYAKELASIKHKTLE